MQAAARQEVSVEDEIEGLLDRQRSALQRLWILLLFAAAAFAALTPLLLDRLGSPLGWIVWAFGLLIVFVILNGTASEYRAAHEAVMRKVARP